MSLDREVYLAMVAERVRRWPVNKGSSQFLLDISDEERRFAEAIADVWRGLSDAERVACGAAHECHFCGRRTKQEPQTFDGVALPSYCGESACVAAFAAYEDRAFGASS